MERNYNIVSVIPKSSYWNLPKTTQHYSMAQTIQYLTLPSGAELIINYHLDLKTRRRTMKMENPKTFFDIGALIAILIIFIAAARLRIRIKSADETITVALTDTRTIQAINTAPIMYLKSAPRIWGWHTNTE